MGKGARNREKKRAEAAAQEVTMRALERLLETNHFGEFEALLSEAPELLSDDVLAQLRQLEKVEDYGIIFRQMRQLLVGARTNPASAYAKYTEYVESTSAAADAIEPIDAAYAARRFDEVIGMVGEALPVAHAHGDRSAISYLHRLRGLAYFNREAGDRAANLDAAVEDLDHALAKVVEPDQAADILMHAGLVIGEHVRGDAGENIERSVELIRLALSELQAESPRELWAIVQTNLARALMRREKGERVANLREAETLCNAALEYRSPAVNAYDWAYTQGNLGDVLRELADLDEVPISEAVRAYEQVIAERDRISADWLVGVAHYSLGRLHRKESELEAERLVDADDEEFDALLDTEPDLRRSREHLLAATALTRSAPDVEYHGRALAELALVLGELDERDSSIDAAREALTILRPANDPRGCAGAAGTLGSQLAQRGDWSGAAEAYRLAISSRELMFHGRLESEARAEEIRRAGNTARWAAFAMARAGSPTEAAVVLEESRTRELRRRLSLEQEDDALVARLPADLRTEYRVAARALAAAPMGKHGAERERQFQEVLATIRARPGFEQFAMGTDPSELQAAAEPGWPVIYVNPTPLGTVALAIAHHTEIRVWFLEEPTSTEIIMRLVVGDAADDPDDDADTTLSGAYLFGLTAEASLDTFRQGLDKTLPWLGEMLARPVRDIIEASGGTGATLILCGPVSATPLHAATWPEGGQQRCLLDAYDIRYGQSAVLTAAALTRSQQRGDAAPRLVALADPANNLRAARAEVDEIARHFGERVERAAGEHATFEFLRRHAPNSTHVHLACHARGGLFDAADAGVQFADALVPVADLTHIRATRARLVVVSACEGAVSEVAGLPDEVFSTGTAMLAAGSACAVASLWSVDDMATALLMTRFYEEMCCEDRRPPEALRRAQLWLRDLSEDRELAFLEEHPALDVEFRRRTANDDRPGRRLPGSASKASSEPCWYSHPDYWASFIAIGC